MNRNMIVLIALLLWGLAMIVPDLIRVIHPLGSFGFYANNDGVIYDVTGPFQDEISSPGIGIIAGFAVVLYAFGILFGQDLAVFLCLREKSRSAHSVLLAHPPASWLQM